MPIFAFKKVIIRASFHLSAYIQLNVNCLFLTHCIISHMANNCTLINIVRFPNPV